MRTAALITAVTLAAGVPVSAALPARPQHLSGGSVDVSVLMYHLVGRLPLNPTPTSTQLTVQPRVFAAQMKWLARHRFHAITPRRLLYALEGRKPLPSRPVLITFDDGYRDVLFNAVPALRRLGMPATAFIITDRVSGPDPSFLTWQQLRDLEHDGFAIGSHTVHHLELPALSPGDATAELTQSRAALARHLGHPVFWFAYPHGAANDAVAALVRRAGYKLAFTTRPGSTQYAGEPFLLHRDRIPRSYGLAGFVALLSSRE